jgi:hypothetical protein
MNLHYFCFVIRHNFTLIPIESDLSIGLSFSNYGSVLFDVFFEESSLVIFSSILSGLSDWLSTDLSIFNLTHSSCKSFIASTDGFR